MTSKLSGAPWRRWLLMVLGLAALASVLWAAYRPRPLEVQTATVAEGRFEQVIEEDGRLRLLQRYTVTSPTAAQLLRPTLKVGDEVQAGDVVAVLAPSAPAMIDTRTRSVLQERLGTAEAGLAAAGANVQRLLASGQRQAMAAYTTAPSTSAAAATASPYTNPWPCVAAWCSIQATMGGPTIWPMP